MLVSIPAMGVYDTLYKFKTAVGQAMGTCGECCWYTVDYCDVYGDQELILGLKATLLLRKYLVVL